MANFQSTERNPWNPFLPTERDLKRTEQLAKKNPVVAGVLSLLLLPIGLVYLNRGINSLKILGYLFVIGFLVGLSSVSEEDANAMGEVVGTAGSVAIAVEQIRAVTEARKRKNASNFFQE